MLEYRPYVLSGKETMVTGDRTTEKSPLEGAAQTDAEPDDAGRRVAANRTLDLKIIPKGLSHSRSEITNDPISHLVFRRHPAKVMDLK